jgi:redox-sensitive bicupin YhaK (pirin superfamily)
LSRQPKAASQPGAKPFPKPDRSGNFVTIASGFAGDKDALPIRADARVLAITLKAGESAQYAPGKKRDLYLVPAAWSVEINGVRVNARDGVTIRDEPVPVVNQIRTYWWCSPPRVGRQRMLPTR